jgi:hypothetical protein
MASEVDICNQALATLGDKASVTSISPPDRSVQAELCARFYPLARDAMLEKHAWSFADARVVGSLLAVETPGWACTYAYPAECVTVRAVIDPFTNQSADFETGAADDGTRVVLTAQEGAAIRFTRAVRDSTKFSPLFVDALALSLASRLAGPLVQGREGRALARELLSEFTSNALPAAINADSSSRLGNVDHAPDWIADR